MNITKKSLITFLTLLILLVGGILYNYGRYITGPFIFGDEYTYFSFAKAIFNRESLATYTQYGPLYPWLISSAFLFKNMDSLYQVIKIMNILIFLSSVIPAYLLAEKCFKKTWLKMLLPVYVMIMPFSGLVNIMWADPLYLALFYWMCLFFYKHIELPTLTNSIGLGLFLSLLYYTKLGAGLVVQIAALIALTYFVISTYALSSRKTKILSICAAITCFLIDLPWFIHFHHLNVSFIGYSVSANSSPIASHIASDGYGLFLWHLLYSFACQFSYLFIGTCGLIGLTFFFFLKYRRDLNAIERNILFFIITSTVGLMCLSAIGISSMSDYRFPVGRYFSMWFPLIVVYTLHILFKSKLEDKKDTKSLIATIFVTLVIAIIASPLYCRSPEIYNSLTELSGIVFIADHSHMIWRPTIEEPSLLLRIITPICFSIFVLIVVLLRKRTYIEMLAAVIISLFLSFSFLAEEYYIVHCGMSVSSMNSVYIYLMKNNINVNQVAFDEKSPPQIYTSLFWMNNPPILENLNMAKEDQEIQFYVSSEQFNLVKVASFEQYIIYKIK